MKERLKEWLSDTGETKNPVLLSWNRCHIIDRGNGRKSSLSGTTEFYRPLIILHQVSLQGNKNMILKKKLIEKVG